MGNVIELRRNKLFSLQEAKGLIPLIKKITDEAVLQVDEIQSQLELLADQHQQSQYQRELTEVIQRWSEKISKLGAEPKGFWLVDFDSGEGYFCWRHPEDALDFFHPYETGLAGRTPIL